MEQGQGTKGCVSSRRLRLVIPDESMEAAATAYVGEHRKQGESELHGGALLEQARNYKDWLAQIRANSKPETVSPQWVVSSVFFAVCKDSGEIVGMLNVRHSLNRFLQEYGGHIGFGVRPCRRRMGYAGEILALGLEYSRGLGLEKVMLACYEDNAASRRTIVSGGGVLERRFIHTDGKAVLVFWIDLED